MAHDVFISYSSHDKKVADVVCGTLEQNNIRCWMAPRDITPGQSYGAEIIRGIDDAKCMVLLFTSSSFSSPHVRKEMERAVSKGLVVIPFRLEDIQVDSEWEYYISSAHWLDAINEPIEEAIASLCETLQCYSILSSDTECLSKKEDVEEERCSGKRCENCGQELNDDWARCPICMTLRETA